MSKFYLDNLHMNPKPQKPTPPYQLTEEQYQHIKPVVTKVFLYRLYDFIKTNEPEINIEDITVKRLNFYLDYGWWLQYGKTVQQFIFCRDCNWYYVKDLGHGKTEKQGVHDEFILDFLKQIKDDLQN